MEPALRLVRLVQIAMMVSVVLLGAVGELVGSSAVASATLFYTLSLVSISTLGMAFVVRRTLVLPAETLLQTKPQDALLQARWKAAYIFLYALCEALALLGLILRLTGFGLSHVWVFYLGGFLLLILFSPRLSP